MSQDTNTRIIELMRNRKILGIKYIPYPKKSSEDSILFRLDDGLRVLLTIQQDCCEKRYFAPDLVELDNLKGNILLDLVFKPTIKESDEFEYMFIDIVTDKSTYTFTSYNEHNGYYNGIEPILTISPESKISLQ